MCAAADWQAPSIGALAMNAFSAPHSRAAVRDEGIEHRLQIEGRPADDVEHVRGRGLLLERLGQLRSPRLDLVEQPHVLDRDHRLVGEGGDELDLLVGERLDDQARDQQDADRRALVSEAGTPSMVRYAAPLLGLARRIFGIGEHIRDVDDRGLRAATRPGDGAAAGRDRVAP